MSKWEELIEMMDKQVSLKEVLDACKDAHEVGEGARYMPWRFMKSLTAKECRQLDDAMSEELEEE